MKKWRIVLSLLALLCFHEGLPSTGWSGDSSLTKVRRWYVQATRFAAKRQHRKAIKAYQKALTFLPRSAQYACTRARTHFQIGTLWQKLRNKSKARASFQRVVQMANCRDYSMKGRARAALRRLAPRRLVKRRKSPVHAAPKSAVAAPVASPPPAPSPMRAPRRIRRHRRSHRRIRRRARRRRLRRPKKSIGPITTNRRIRDPQAILTKRTKSKSKGSKKPNLRVWQRSKTNTIISKVSVGGGKYLKLEKFRVSVQIEGMRVRTTIDHIYRNPYPMIRQGTFKYTLPADASVSYYAMFVGNQRRRMPRFFRGRAPSPRRLAQMKPQLIARTAPGSSWGRLREARLVPAEKGRQVYEAIKRRNVDPALLEQDAPNTFTGRVFPIPANGYNRVIIAYEQTLPQLQGHHVYRFRFPPDVAKMIDFSIAYNPKLGRLVKQNLKALRCRQKPTKAFVRCYWEQNKPKKDAVFYFKPGRNDVAWLAGKDPVNQQKYLLAQLKVQLPKGRTLESAPQALFLLDTSLSAQPDLFAAHVALLKQVLEKNQQIKRFNVLFFDIGAQWARPKGWMANNAVTRRQLLRKIHSILLEGATDFSAAMRALARPTWAVKSTASTRTDVFVLSDGQISWGNRHIDQVMYQFYRKQPWGQLRFFAYQLGIGSENLRLMRRLVKHGGALFPCLNRASLGRCATAHTKSSLWLQRVEVKGIEASQVMIAGRQSQVFDGAILTLAASFKNDGKATIVLHGRYMGKPYRKQFSLDLKASGDLGPRAWGEMAIAQLLNLDDPAYNKLAIAYAQHFLIPNKLCSFLVLETNKEYKQYGLDKWKQQKKVSDLADFLKKTWASKGKPVSPRARWQRLVRRVSKRYKFAKTPAASAIHSLLNASADRDFVLNTPGAKELVRKTMTPAAYRKQRTLVTNDFTPFTKEAKRRLRKGTKGLPTAIRALSCITEKHPSNAQGLRLVGYYLRAWKQPTMAAQLFWRVLERRSFEPHAFRDVAISMMQLRRYALAAAMYEVILKGKWHSRFRGLRTLAKEEYALLQAEALRDSDLSPKVRKLLKERQSTLALRLPASQLRVTVTWNTDSTDIDLWVLGPHGETCKFSKKRTSDGGQLLQDVTRGYGPERYQNILALPGTYQIKLHYYGHRTTVFGNETHVSVLVVRKAGTKEQSTQLKSLVLKRKKSLILVQTLKL